MFLLGSLLCFAIVARASLPSEQCPVNVLSCQSGAGDSCCSPTKGLIVLAQQWEHVGPPDAWTMHGLWPYNCDGSQPGWNVTGWDGCRDHSQFDVAGNEMTRVVQMNPPLYQRMITYWPSRGPRTDGGFWTIEWGRHGTCFSTLDPKCYKGPVGYRDVYDYFDLSLRLRREFDLYAMLRNHGVVPGKNYHVTEFEKAIQAELGVKPTLTCNGTRLIDILLYFHVKNGKDYVPTNSVVNPHPPAHADKPCTGYINYFVK